MRSVAELRREHSLVEQLLDRVDRALEESGPDGIPVSFLQRVLAFCQTVVDRCHHGKEEGCFFPCLERLGIPREGGPIGVMLEEHEVLRGIVRSIGDRVGSLPSERTSDGEVLGLLRRYSELLRLHIAKENEILFPLAGDVMGEEDDRETGACYDVTEARVGRDELARARALGGEGPGAARV